MYSYVLLSSELVSRALSSGLQTGADYLLVWLAWLDLYRRRLSADAVKGADLMEKMREQFNKACEHLAQGKPTVSLHIHASY